MHCRPPAPPVAARAFPGACPASGCACHSSSCPQPHTVRARCPPTCAPAHPRNPRLAAQVPLCEPMGWSSRAAGTILGYTFTPGSVVAIAISSVLGLLVNLSTFLVRRCAALYCTEQSVQLACTAAPRISSPAGLSIARCAACSCCQSPAAP